MMTCSSMLGIVYATYVLITFSLLLLLALHMATPSHPYFTSSIPGVYRGSARYRQFIDVSQKVRGKESRLAENSKTCL